MVSAFSKATSLLRSHMISFRLIAHPEEGNTVRASLLRRNRVGDAAKTLLLRASYRGPKKRRYFLAVLPGDRLADLTHLSSITDAKKIGFATVTELALLTGCVPGAVPPLSLSDNVDLIVDRALITTDRIVFNIGRLDISAVISSSEYLNKIPSVVVNFSKINLVPLTEDLS